MLTSSAVAEGTLTAEQKNFPRHHKLHQSLHWHIQDHHCKQPWVTCWHRSAANNCAFALTCSVPYDCASVLTSSAVAEGTETAEQKEFPRHHKLPRSLHWHIQDHNCKQPQPHPSIIVTNTNTNQQPATDDAIT